MSLHIFWKNEFEVCCDWKENRTVPTWLEEMDQMGKMILVDLMKVTRNEILDWSEYLDKW